MRMAKCDLRVAETARSVVVGLVQNPLLGLAIWIVAADAAEYLIGRAEIVIDAGQPLPSLPDLWRLYQEIQTACIAPVRIGVKLRDLRTCGVETIAGNLIFG